jgi:hypothetical protein
MHGSYAFSTDYAAPHYEQARQWHRFARLLRRVRCRAYDRKEEALAWSLARGTRALCFPLALETRPAHDRGLFRLMRRMKGYGGPAESESSVPQRFPELEARTVYLKDEDVQDEDARRVELLLHAPAPSGTAALLPVGYLPEDDGAWAIPLLHQHLSLQFFVYDFTPGTAWRGSRGLSATAEVLVVVAGAHEAGRTWIDIYDDRKSTRAEHSALRPAPDASVSFASVPFASARVACVKGPYMSPPAGSYLQATDAPTVEDWLREDTWRRETCLSDLPGADYWQVTPHL